MKVIKMKKGQSLAEFALILPLLLFMMIVLLDLGRAVLDYSILDTAVREGTRYAVVEPGGPNQAAIVQQINKFTFNISNFNASSMVSFPAPSDTKKIKIKIVYPYQPIIPGLLTLFGAGKSFNITVQSEMFLTPYSQ